MLFRAGMLIDGTGAPPMRDCFLSIEGGRVAAVGRQADFAAGAVAAAVDYSACAILPGLIDCHVHLFLEGIADMKVRGERWRDPAEITLLRAAKNTEAALRKGVTTVRDLGGPAGIATILKKAVAENVLAGPRILTCHRAISAPGGHFHYAGGREASGPTEVGRAVREQLKAGADVIKLMVTGMVNFRSESAGAIELGGLEVQAAVREAGRFARPVSVHANGSEGVKQAVAAGARTLEHGALLDAATVDLLAASGVYWVPTLTPFRRMLDYGTGHTVAALPPSGLQRVYDSHRAMVGRAIAAGARVVAGTDAGSFDVRHGEVWQEVALFVESGMPPLKAIAAATGLAAEAVGLADAGTIAAGKRADFIVVAGNPLADMTLLGKVAHVYKDGVKI